MLYGSLEPLLIADFVSAVEDHPSYEDIQRNQRLHIIDKEGRRIGDGIKVYGMGVQAALLASVASHPLLVDILTFYEHTSLDEILFNKYTAPTVIAHHCEKYGFLYKDKKQELTSSILLHPTCVISNYDQKGKSSVAVHQCAGSWTNKTLKNRIAKRLNHYPLYKKLIFFLKSIFKR